MKKFLIILLKDWKKADCLNKKINSGRKFLSEFFLCKILVEGMNEVAAENLKKFLISNFVHNLKQFRLANIPKSFFICD